jgi:Protein of unknown function (DUF2809)
MDLRKAYGVYSAGVVIIFAIEVAIATGAIGDGFVRGSVGDILVIMLIYCVLRVFSLAPARAAALATAAGFVAEALQYVHMADLLGLQEGSVPYILLGNTFSVLDLVMYLIGGALALAIDRLALLRWLRRQ